MIQTLMVLGQAWHVDQKETDEIQNICTSPDEHSHKLYVLTLPELSLLPSAGREMSTRLQATW